MRRHSTGPKPPRRAPQPYASVQGEPFINPATGQPYINADGTVWLPQHTGQRPPFQPGNKLTPERPHFTHGADARSTYEPIAEQITQELISAHPYLADRRFGELLRMYTVRMAQLQLVNTWISTQSPAEVITNVRSHSAPLERQRALSVQTMNLARQLGLTPEIPEKVATAIAAANRAIDRRTTKQAVRTQLRHDLGEQLVRDWLANHPDEQTHTEQTHTDRQAN